MSGWPRFAAGVLAISASTWAFTDAAQAAPTLCRAREAGSSLLDQLHGRVPPGADGFTFVAAPAGTGELAASDEATSPPEAAPTRVEAIDLSASTPWWTDRETLAIAAGNYDVRDVPLPEVVIVPAPDGFHYGIAGLSLVAGLQAWRSVSRRH